MELTELTNRFNDSSIMKNVTAIKDHIKEYFLLGNTEDGIINLKLDIIGDETLSADCDVTDHYTEKNEPFQDQIALKPIIYTINGEVGELVWYQKDTSSQVLGQVAQRLEGVISFLPVSSRGFTQFKKTAMKAAQWIDTASNALSKVSNLMSKSLEIGSRSVTNQEQAYMYLTEFRDNRTLLTVQTPWGILKNYVITNLKFNQPKETKDKTFISITIKEIRLVKVTTVPFDAKKFQGNALYENQPKSVNGKTDGEDNSISVPNTKENQKKLGINDDKFEDGGWLSSVKSPTGVDFYPVKYLDGKLTIYGHVAETGELVELNEQDPRVLGGVGKLAEQAVSEAIERGEISEY